MKVNFQLAKILLYRIIFSFDLTVIIITVLSTEISNKKVKEYTGVSHFFLNSYIIIIFIILLGHSICPRFKPKIIKKYFNFIFTNKGQIIITFLISMIYRFSKSVPHYILGLLLFFSSFILFIFEIIFCLEALKNIFKEKGIEIINIKNNDKNYIGDENNKKNFLKIVEIKDEINPNNNHSNSSRLDIENNFKN